MVLQELMYYLKNILNSSQITVVKISRTINRWEKGIDEQFLSKFIVTITLSGLHFLISINFKLPNQ